MKKLISSGFFLVAVSSAPAIAATDSSFYAFSKMDPVVMELSNDQLAAVEGASGKWDSRDCKDGRPTHGRHDNHYKHRKHYNNNNQTCTNCSNTAYVIQVGGPAIAVAVGGGDATATSSNTTTVNQGINTIR